jgi:hypothetical protein
MRGVAALLTMRAECVAKEKDLILGGAKRRLEG